MGNLTKYATCVALAGLLCAGVAMAGEAAQLGSVALAAAGPGDTEPPTPQPAEPIKSPEEQPQLSVPKIGTENVAQIDEPAAQTAIEPMRPGWNPRYRSTFEVHGSSCFGVAGEKRTIDDHRPGIKGSGFYLPLPRFSSIFKESVTLPFAPKTERYAMKFVGPFNVDVPMMAGFAHGDFVGYWSTVVYPKVLGDEYFVIVHLKGACSINASIVGELISRK